MQKPVGTWIFRQAVIAWNVTMTNARLSLLAQNWISCAESATQSGGFSAADIYGLGFLWRTVGVVVLAGGSRAWPGTELRTGG